MDGVKGRQTDIQTDGHKQLLKQYNH